MAATTATTPASKMIDDFMRFGERMGERAMYTPGGADAAARSRTPPAPRGRPTERKRDSPRAIPPEWAKLTWPEFQGIGGLRRHQGDHRGQARGRARRRARAWFRRARPLGKRAPPVPHRGRQGGVALVRRALARDRRGLRARGGRPRPRGHAREGPRPGARRAARSAVRAEQARAASAALLRPRASTTKARGERGAPASRRCGRE